MFLAWLAARSGLAAQYLCLFSAVFEIHQGKKFALATPERPHGEFQLLQVLAGVWLSRVFMSTSSVGIFDYLAKQNNPVFRRSHILLPWSSLFVLRAAHCAHVLSNHITQRYHCDAPGSGGSPILLAHVKLCVTVP